MKAATAFLTRCAVLVTLGLLVSCGFADDTRARQFAALPDWRGVWIAEGLAPKVSGLFQDDGGAGFVRVKLRGLVAPWNEAGRARFERWLAGLGTVKSEGWGYPMMMNGSAPLQFVITPEETLIVNAHREVRHVYTDGRALPRAEDRWATPWGESIGRWEGDTLVVETIAVDEPAKYFGMAPPLSADARYTERLRKTAPDRIESRMTIEDSATLREPWVADLVYTRATGLDRLIHDAFTNDRSELDGDVYTIAPPKN
jgi:hypothetical protein